MSSKVLQFPKQSEVVLPQIFNFDVSDADDAPCQTFIFTDQHGGTITVEFGDPELGPVIDVHDASDKLVMHLCLAVLGGCQNE